MVRTILALGAYATLALAAYPLAASEQVALSRAVFLETATSTPSGRMRSIAPAESVSRGDKVILVVEWRAPTHSKGFTVSSPVPAHLTYARSSDDSVEVSVDGGRNWGLLDSTRMGSRKATPEDVTHLRWRIPAHKARSGSGRITYSAFVR
ncbi:MAG: hypothetical protein H6918_09550 [Sphingomonadaceae bacterium]|nr:hypothetical protein [Sphingomonadaceae bacterium]